MASLQFASSSVQADPALQISALGEFRKHRVIGRLGPSSDPSNSTLLTGRGFRQDLEKGFLLKKGRTGAGNNPTPLSNKPENLGIQL